MLVRSAVKRSCVGALAFRLGGTKTTRAYCAAPRVLTACTTVNTRLFSSSSFTPPEPPSSKGISVYPDIDLSSSLQVESESARRNSDTDAVFVVQGASRGIGLQFVKSLVERTEGTVVACCRSPETANGLNEFIETLDDPSRVHVIALDLEDQESIEQASATIRDQFNRVDVLLNVAGLLGDAKTTPGPERSIAKLDREWTEKTMAVNVIGPVMFSKEMAPLMKTKQRGKNKGEERPASVIASLSARVGSISDNELGGWYSYRFSKAALNQATRTMAHELKRQGTFTVALHPGTTDTDLSKPFQRNVAEGRLFPVDFTVNQLLDCVDNMTAEHSGGLYDWSGRAIPF